jgi:hypothetical protein
LKGIASASLKVTSGCGINLKLCIDIQITLDNVPVSSIRECSARASEVVLPVSVEPAIGWSVPSEGSGCEKEQRDEDWL